MGNSRPTSELFIEYEQLISKRREAANGSGEAMHILMEKYRSLQSEIMSFCRSEGFLGVMQKLCGINAGKLRFSPAQGRIEFMGKVPPPLPFNHRNCFEIKDNAKKMVLAVRSGRPDDEAAIKKLCVGYVTLITIANSAKELFAQARNAQNTEALQNINQIEQQMESLGAEIKARMGVMSDDHDNKGIYIGSRAVTSNPDMLERIKSTLGIDGDIPDEKIVLSTKEGSSAVFITVSGEEKGSESFRDFVNGIFYKNFLNFNVGELSVACVEHTELSNLPITYMNGKLRKYDKEEANLGAYSYSNIAQNKDAADKMISSIVSEMNERKILIGSSDECGSIEEYNKSNPYSKRPYILLLISGYHRMLTSWSHDFSDIISILKDGGKYGIFTIMMEEEIEVLDNDSGTNIAPDFAALGVRRVSFSDRLFKKVTATPAEVDSIRRTAKSELKMSEVLFLDDLLENNPTVSHFSKEITIPVGLSEGKMYYFATSVDSSKGEFHASPFTLIIGATGMGKSAFLHTLILSGAMSYSPDELQFYIVDFKSKQDSAEFACYLKNEKQENLYIPHVRYLSMKSTAENAYDVLDMINTLADERAALFASVDAKDFIAYNSEERIQSRVRNGEIPHVPQIYFLIDEYITMLGGGVGGDQEASFEIEKKFSDILQRIRTSGVGIIFSGQRCAFGKDSLANIGNRISFDPGDESLLSRVYDFEIGKEDASDLYRRISGKVGTAASTRKAGASQKDIVRTAFSGKHMGERQLAIARAIREKYSDPRYYVKQIVPGKDVMENGDSFLDTPNSKPITIEERKRQAENKELNIPLCLGISAMSAKPQVLRYYLQKHRGALVLAKPPKQEYIERNAAVSLLHYMAVNGNKPNDSTIILNDLKSDDMLTDEFGNIIEGSSARHALEKVLDANGLLHLCSVNHSALDISRAIMDADELRNKRMRGQTRDKKPVLLIVHDADSLMSLEDALENEINNLQEITLTAAVKNTSSVAQAEDVSEGKSADAPAVAVEGDLSMDDLRALLGDDFSEAFGEEALGDIYDESITLEDVPDTPTQPGGADNRIFNADEVIRALRRLMEKGNTQNIFVLAAFSSSDAAKELLGIDFSRNDLCKEYSGVIYGSDGVRKTRSLEKDENTDCAFILPQELKMRLYDFSSKAKDFWRNLKQILNN